MSRIKELEKFGEEEHIFPCDCGGGDYLRIVWDELDPDFRFMWLEAWANKVTLKDRIIGAWKILRGRAWQHTEIILTVDTVEELKKLFNSK